MELQHLSNFELQQMCYFMEVIEAENNLSRAAELLHIEQPPFSQRMRSLSRVERYQIALSDTAG